MRIINKSARLIDFSFDDEVYRLMPAGKAVEVPDSASSSAFLKALIKEGSVDKIEDSVVEPPKKSSKVTTPSLKTKSK